jgi:hypothetical protein
MTAAAETRGASACPRHSGTGTRQPPFVIHDDATRLRLSHTKPTAHHRKFTVYPSEVWVQHTTSCWQAGASRGKPGQASREATGSFIIASYISPGRYMSVIYIATYQCDGPLPGAYYLLSTIYYAGPLAAPPPPVLCPCPLPAPRHGPCPQCPQCPICGAMRAHMITCCSAAC